MFTRYFHRWSKLTLAGALLILITVLAPQSMFQQIKEEKEPATKTTMEELKDSWRRIFQVAGVILLVAGSWRDPNRGDH